MRRGSVACKGSAIEYHRHKYDVDPITGCWIWNAALFGEAYAYVWHNGRGRCAHVVFWEERNGPVPKGKELDHFVCQIKRCVNPEHVEPVSGSENVRRGYLARRKRGS